MLRQLVIADAYGVPTAASMHIALRNGVIGAELEPFVRFFTSGAIAGVIATLIAALLYLLIKDDCREPGEP